MTRSRFLRFRNAISGFSGRSLSRRAAAIVLGAAMLALGAGEAEAQVSWPVCPSEALGIPAASLQVDGQPVTDRETIRAVFRSGAGIIESPYYPMACRYGYEDRRNRAIAVNNPRITTVDDFLPGIEGWHEGIGHLDIFVHEVDLSPGSPSTFELPHPSDYGNGVYTTGNAADYVFGEASYGIYGKHEGEGRIALDVRDVNVRTTGDGAYGLYAWGEGSYILREGGEATRAKGLVIVNLIESNRDREERVRPQVATRGDNADAIRAEYTAAASYGHVVVNVEGYAISTGGVLTLPQVAYRWPISNYVFDPNRPWVLNTNHNPDDPDSPQFYNIILRQKHRLTTPPDPYEGEGTFDFRNFLAIPVNLARYAVVYLPVRNPYYDPKDPSSGSEFISGRGVSSPYIWNGRYFQALSDELATDLAACEEMADPNACYEEKDVAGRLRGSPTGYNARGVFAKHEGRGDVSVSLTDAGVLTWGADSHGVYALHAGKTITAEDTEGNEVVTEGGGDIAIRVGGGSSIATEGDDAHGVYGHHRGAGGVSIDLGEASVTTKGALAFGVLAQRDETGEGDVSVAVNGGSIATEGRAAYALWALQQSDEGDVSVALTNASLSAKGGEAHGAFAQVQGRTTRDDGTVVLSGSVIDQEAEDAKAFLSGRGGVSINVNGGSIATEGENAHGVYGAHQGEEGDVSISVANASISTTGGGTEDDAGTGGHGVYGLHISAGGVSIDVNGGSITTTGDAAYGVRILHTGTTGDVSFRMTDGEVSASGAEAHAVRVEHDGDAGAVSVSLSGGSAAATGADAYGVYISTQNDATLMVGADARVSASSGVAILADGAGELDATIAGTVSGDVRSIALGGFTAEISGTVKGDVRSSGDLTATIAGMVTGDVEGLGDGDHAVTVEAGGVVKNTIRLAASEVTLNGTAGRVWLEAGGTVTVGATGRITGVDGVTIQSDGGELTVNLNLASRRVADVLGVPGGGIKSSDPDALTLLVNGETLNAGATAANGAFDIRLSDGLSLSEFYAPRAGLYEALPGLLLRLGGAQSKGERKTLPGSPVWASVLSGNGSRGKANSTVSKEDGVKYDFDQSGAEAGLGLSFPWVDGLRASLSIRQVNASANLSMGSGKGEIDLEGVGYAFGFSWENGGGWYASGDLGLTDYAADFVSGSRGGLKHDVDASVRSLNLEAGRRLTLDRWAKRIALTPRVWVTRASVDVDDFTDSAGARFKLVEGDRLTGGAGVVAEAGFARGGGRLSLRGALDVETALSGEKTSVEVSGHRLHAEAEKTRFLMGVGARWRKGRFEIGGELNAAGLGSDDRTLGGRLNLGVQF